MSRQESTMAYFIPFQGSVSPSSNFHTLFEEAKQRVAEHQNELTNVSAQNRANIRQNERAEQRIAELQEKLTNLSTENQAHIYLLKKAEQRVTELQNELITVSVENQTSIQSLHKAKQLVTQFQNQLVSVSQDRVRQLREKDQTIEELQLRHQMKSAWCYQNALKPKDNARCDGCLLIVPKVSLAPCFHCLCEMCSKSQVSLPPSSSRPTEWVRICRHPIPEDDEKSEGLSRVQMLPIDIARVKDWLNDTN